MERGLLVRVEVGRKWTWSGRKVLLNKDSLGFNPTGVLMMLKVSSQKMK